MYIPITRYYLQALPRVKLYAFQSNENLRWKKKEKSYRLLLCETLSGFHTFS